MNYGHPLHKYCSSSYLGPPLPLSPPTPHGPSLSRLMVHWDVQMGQQLLHFAVTQTCTHGSICEVLEQFILTVQQHEVIVELSDMTVI